MSSNKLTYFFFFVGIFISTVFVAQNSRTGTPISWNIDDNILASSQNYILNDPNIPAYLFEDEINNQFTDKPYRFASGIPVDYSFVNGTWRTIGGNGDRIWTIIINVPGATGIGVDFDEFHLPKGAKLFIYNEDRTQLKGAYTQLDNKPSEILITLPIQDETIVIEYFEPIEKQGQGRINIASINYQYQELNSLESTDCSFNAKCSDNINEKQLNSVVQIITNDGKVLGTGILVSSVESNARPFILTSSKLDIGNSEGWHFLFHNYSETCESVELTTTAFSSIGASVVEKMEDSGIMLLQLLEEPTSEWNIYYSGWSRTTEISENSYSLHFADGRHCEATVSNEVLEFDDEDKSFYSNQVNYGVFGAGSIGAPLFDNKGFLKGLFVRGNYDCINNTGKNEFIAFSSIWDKVKDYLDPIHLDPIYAEGKEPSNLSNSLLEKREDIVLYPMPAKNSISILNNDSNVELISLKVFNVQGQEVKNIALNDQMNQNIDISSLVNGWYVFQFMSNTALSNYSVLIAD